MSSLKFLAELMLICGVQKILMSVLAFATTFLAISAKIGTLTIGATSSLLDEKSWNFFLWCVRSFSSFFLFFLRYMN